MAGTMPVMRARTALLLDAVSVVAFVAIGRVSHDDGVLSAGGLLALSPFAIALAGGWAVTRAWRHPAALATGASIWAITVIGGLLLRSALPGRDLEPSFVIVTALVLALMIVGWRVVATVATRQPTRRRGSRSTAR